MSSSVTRLLPIGTACCAFITLTFSTPLTSQQQEPPQTIDILIEPLPDQQLVEQCDEDQEAAIISGEIVVCRQIRDQSEYRYSQEAAGDGPSRQEQIDNFGLPKGLPADFAGPGIFRGKPTAGGGCLPGSCPPPAAIIIDLEAIPEAPPGSDADRIGRGLPPLGNDGGTGSQIDESELALPPTPVREPEPN